MQNAPSLQEPTAIPFKHRLQWVFWEFTLIVVYFVCFGIVGVLQEEHLIPVLDLLPSLIKPLAIYVAQTLVVLPFFSVLALEIQRFLPAAYRWPADKQNKLLLITACALLGLLVFLVPLSRMVYIPEPSSSIRANAHSLQSMVETFGVNNQGAYPHNLQELEKDANVSGNLGYWRSFNNPIPWESQGPFLHSRTGNSGLGIALFDEGQKVIPGGVSYSPVKDKQGHISCYQIFAYDSLGKRIKFQNGKQVLACV